MKCLKTFFSQKFLQVIDFFVAVGAETFYCKNGDRADYQCFELRKKGFSLRENSGQVSVNLLKKFLRTLFAHGGIKGLHFQYNLQMAPVG